MAAEIWNQSGRRLWELERDDDGHRTYKLVTLVRAATTDGPATVITCPGLPAIGSYWRPPLSGDFDFWAFCWPTCRVMAAKGVNQEQPFRFWEVENTFSTKPRWRCGTATIEDPLLEPARVGGSFLKYRERAWFDRDGKKIKNSSHEPLKPIFDANRPTVWVEQNDSVLGLPIFSQLMDNVNDAPMWGLPKRCVKLSNCTWERKLYGICTFYYTRRMEFDINFNTFDQEILDYGTKVLIGRWSAGPSPLWVPDAGLDPTNPTHFMSITDIPGNIMKGVDLDGGGLPLTLGATPVKIKVEKYLEANLFLLGVPPSF
jgi:hypothetical protein